MSQIIGNYARAGKIKVAAREQDGLALPVAPPNQSEQLPPAPSAGH